jgi:hypothetical protein
VADAWPAASSITAAAAKMSLESIVNSPCKLAAKRGDEI